MITESHKGSLLMATGRKSDMTATTNILHAYDQRWPRAMTPLFKHSCMDGIFHLRLSMNKVTAPQGLRAETQGLREERIVSY